MNLPRPPRSLLSPDLHGFGESDLAPVGALDPVVDVLDTLDHLGVTSCHLVGSSLGAGVALEVAVTLFAELVELGGADINDSVEAQSGRRPQLED